MAYLATTVLIEGEQSPQRPLPVRVRNITVFPFQNAVIEQVVSPAGEHEPVVMGGTALIQGQRLAGDVQAVRVGEVDIPSDTVGVAEITVPLTDPNLRAGVQGVRVIYTNGSESNVAPLILRPAITKDLADNYEISVSGVVTDPEDGTHAATVTVKLTPEVGQRQRVVLYLNEAPPSAAPVQAYTFLAEPRTSDTDTVDFAISGVTPGNYLVRVQVAGAETLLETDGTGTYNAPQVTI